MRFLKFLISKVFIKNLGLSILVTIVIVLSVLLWLKIFTHHGRSKPVPDFYGMTPDEADSLASKMKFRVEIVDSVYDNNAEKGTIVEQNPAVSKMVKKNRRIFLTINTVNAEMVIMPGVVGTTHRQAKTILETNGLEVGRLSYVPDLAVNNVLKQLYFGTEIEEGDTVPKGASIDLVLGTGLSNRKTIAPDLTGLTFEVARNKILNAALNLGAVLYDETILDGEDTLQAFVWKQNPVFDEENLVRLGSPVYLWLTVDSTRLPETDTLNINPELKDANKYNL